MAAALVDGGALDAAVGGELVAHGRQVFLHPAGDGADQGGPHPQRLPARHREHPGIPGAAEGRRAEAAGRS